MKNQEKLEYLKHLSDEGKIHGKHFGDIPNEIYHHKDCPGISSSGLKLLNKSIHHYLYSLDHPKSSDAMQFGSAFHDAILLPDVYKDKYAVVPKLDKRTKEGKDTYAEFLLKHKDKTLLDSEDAKKIEEISLRIRESNNVRQILSKGEAEVSFWWNDEDFGTLCKCRADWIYTDGENTVLVDLKTSSKGVSRLSFAKSIVNYSYDLSAAFYIDGINKCLGTNLKTMAIIAIENEAPYDIGLYCLSPDAITTGRDLYKKALQKYNEFILDPLVSKLAFANKEFEIIDIPEWAKNIETRGE